MQHRVRRLWAKLRLRQRTLSETMNDQVKHSSQTEPTRPRRVTGFLVNLLTGVSAYRHRPKQPALGLSRAPLGPRLVM